MEFERRKTRQLSLGGVLIGGGAPIAVQSMTKTHTWDIPSTLEQIRRLEEAGCEIVRVAVPDRESAVALEKIKAQSFLPVIADIHFDYRLALEALKKGVDGLRINPGNIGSRDKIEQVVIAAKERQVPIRIGVNSGSIEKDLLTKYDGARAEAMVESALRHVRIFEDLNFTSIKISLKASDVGRTLDAYRLLAKKVDYPFHAGITEAGSLISGTVKSSVGLALLLREGLADTIRVSLTAPPEQEVRVAYGILSSLNLRTAGPNIVSCPVCGRCEVDFFSLVERIEEELALLKTDVTIAVMGCMVNGPGEAKEADIGLACGKGKAAVFEKGKLKCQLKEDEIVSGFAAEVKRFVREKK